MGFTKVVEARMWTITAQNSDVRLTTGTSASGTFTGKANPLKGSLMWDRAMFVLQGVSVAGVATGGSYTVTLQTDAIKGYTGLPIASATIGPLSPATVVMDSLHQSSAAPLPTHIFIDQTATGGGIWFTCDVIAKQYRGTLGTPGGTAERVLQGTMKTVVSGASGSVSQTYAIGGSASNIGMNRMRHWDNAMFWTVAGVTIAGTHDVDIIGTVGGATVSIASTGTGGALNVAGEKLALANNFYGQSPNPSAIIWTETTTGGVSDARVVMIAKSGRGSLAKR